LDPESAIVDPDHALFVYSLAYYAGLGFGSYNTTRWSIIQETIDHRIGPMIGSGRRYFHDVHGHP
jgi:hypothetical protein